MKYERIPNLKVLESGISECLESGIHKHGIRNAESMGWNPESKIVLDSFTWGEQSVDESVPCFSEVVEHDILSSRLACFRDAAASFDCTESVCGSHSSLQSNFSHYFSPGAVCYSYPDVHDLVAQTGEPNYLVARVPVPSALNISA